MKKRLLAGVLAGVMAVGIMPGSMMEKAGVKKDVEAAVTLQNPRIEADASMEAGQKVTYDCVWFGSYPQTEIVDQASICGTYGKAWVQSSDYEENISLYTSLKNAPDDCWNSNGEIALENGEKYRRIKYGDTTISQSSNSYASEAYYTWNSTNSYHYFRYEPIKWRILNTDGNQALLLADKTLDNQKYDHKYNSYEDTSETYITWKASTIRSWLNGYGSSANNCGTDYTGKNFINSAFNSSERSAVKFTDLDNKTTGPYSESKGGSNTTDKIFLLSSYDLCDTDRSVTYGFGGGHDEAAKSLSSTFAKAMGTSGGMADYIGYCSWWLRSPGKYTISAAYVNSYGLKGVQGDYVFREVIGIRPALYLDFSNTGVYSYAGTVCTDGTIKEVKPGSATVIPGNTKKNQTITASNKSIAINSKPVSLGAKTNGNGKLTYSSSAKSVATISSSGAITPKNYGTTTITIKAAETTTYKAASKKVKVKVVPKKMTLTTVKSPAKKTLLLKWKKDASATKYEIQLCMKKDFKKKTLSRTYNKKVFKQTIKNMKSKTWYVRMRAWKKVGGKTYYGIWSKVKKIKIK